MDHAKGVRQNAHSTRRLIAVYWACLIQTRGVFFRRKAAWHSSPKNHKQLGCGMMIYITKNQNSSPGTVPRNFYAYKKEECIYWRTTPPLYPPVEKSPIAVHLGSVSSNLFRCPADKDNS